MALAMLQKRSVETLKPCPKIISIKRNVQSCVFMTDIVDFMMCEMWIRGAKLENEEKQSSFLHVTSRVDPFYNPTKYH